MIFLRTPENPCLPTSNLLQLFNKLQIIHTHPEAHRTRDKNSALSQSIFQCHQERYLNLGFVALSHQI